MSTSPADIHRVDESRSAHLANLLARAFYEDPTWRWAFPDPDARLDQHRTLWTIYLHSAIPYGWVWMSNDGGATAVWIPPGVPELSTSDEALVERLVRYELGAHAQQVLELMESFDALHPHEPHYYLSLLGTHPDHRGHGKGIGLLSATLELIDAEGMPAYLESSNRANDHRYERLGFVQVGEFSAPGGGPSVACMWRAAR